MNGMEVLEIKEETKWTSKKELMSNLQISSDTIEQIINDLISRTDAATQIHIKKGGYHNSEVFYVCDYNYNWFRYIVKLNDKEQLEITYNMNTK